MDGRRSESPADSRELATIVVVGLVVGWPGLVGAQPLTPIPHPIGAPDPAARGGAIREPCQQRPTGHR